MNIIDFCEKWFKNHYEINMQERQIVIFENSDFWNSNCRSEMLEELRTIVCIDLFEQKFGEWKISFSYPE